MQVKFDIRLAAGFESKIIAVAEAQKLDPRWIVLDGYIILRFLVLFLLSGVWISFSKTDYLISILSIRICQTLKELII